MTYRPEQGTLRINIEHAGRHEGVILHQATYSFRKVGHSVTMSKPLDMTPNVDELRDLCRLSWCVATRLSPGRQFPQQSVVFRRFFSCLSPCPGALAAEGCLLRRSGLLE